MNEWTSYLNKPWQVGCDGPDSFDCWGLLVDIYKKHLYKELPRFSDLNKLNRLDVAKKIGEEIQSQWELLEQPIHLSAVGMSHLPNKVFHVGCFLDIDGGYVIHTRKDYGCMIEPLPKINFNFKYVSFYGLR